MSQTGRGYREKRDFSRMRWMRRQPGLEADTEMAWFKGDNTGDFTMN
ncbi:hypothetical protein [Pseudomonas sp. Irchel s3a18]|nr:hypothetical protein [Pseudomonas sp. Irchel s3a18]